MSEINRAQINTVKFIDELNYKEQNENLNVSPHRINSPKVMSNNGEYLNMINNQNQYIEIDATNNNIRRSRISFDNNISELNQNNLNRYKNEPIVNSYNDFYDNNYVNNNTNNHINLSNRGIMDDYDNNFSSNINLNYQQNNNDYHNDVINEQSEDTSIYDSDDDKFVAQELNLCGVVANNIASNMGQELSQQSKNQLRYQLKRNN